MKKFLAHFLFPHESNKHKAQLLHSSTILYIAVAFFLGGLFLSSLRTAFPQVLGVSSNITIEKLLILTNKERLENNLPPLELNPELSLAASKKAQDMLAYDYWAHNSPNGKSPWVFIKDAGYNYFYAGENLARGFNNAEDVVSAWMASSQHRANILSENYKDVGFAVATGRLRGEETVLIVEELGSQASAVIAQNQNKQNTSTLSSSYQLSASSISKPIIDTLSLSSILTRTILALFILVLILDMIIIKRKKIIRLFRHNLDHVFFLALILLVIIILTRGVVI